MDDSSTTTATVDQTDEDILTYHVSDEALEAAAGTERGAALHSYSRPACHFNTLYTSLCC
jgi:hypothetical protein